MIIFQINTVTFILQTKSNSKIMMSFNNNIKAVTDNKILTYNSKIILRILLNNGNEMKI